jgi:ADP-heptose:LPS heptosyltransferase/predicted SAM-dependent methyltransferase
MTWYPDPAKNRAYQSGESVKIMWELVPYTRGSGIELGCGPFKAFPHFTGIDANRYEGEKFGPQLVMDCSHLGSFADRGFDFVYSSHLLEHLQDTAAVLTEWWRVIDVGGHLVLYLPHRDFYPNIGEPGGNEDHKHDFVPADIVDIMRGVAPHWDLLECQERGDEDEYSFFLVFRKLTEGLGQTESWKLPKPAKRAAVMRPGAYGDALMASSVFRHLKREGYHVTVYTEEPGEQILRHDPHVDRIVMIGTGQIPTGFLAQYFQHEVKKYERAIDLMECVEKNALGWPRDCRYFWPAKVRRQIFGDNYVERIHQLAELPQAEYEQRYYATAAEQAEAKAWQKAHCGDEPMVVIAPTGSTAPKFWPYLQGFLKQLAAVEIHAVILGDLRGMKAPADPRIHEIGLAWPMRKALALALRADVVIGQETGLLNAVAMEPMRKIVLLSHSTAENLTKHWVNTETLTGNVPCYPCHRIHLSFDHCVRDEATGAAACQAAISPEALMEQVRRRFIKPDDPVLKAIEAINAATKEAANLLRSLA